MNVVARGAPFRLTCAPSTKSLPRTYSVQPLGVSPVTTGIGFSPGSRTRNVTGSEAPKPGVMTVTNSLPAFARSALVSSISRVCPSRTVLGRTDPFHRPTDWAGALAEKLYPVNVTQMAALPDTTEAGARLARAGAAGTPGRFTRKLTMVDLLEVAAVPGAASALRAGAAPPLVTSRPPSPGVFRMSALRVICRVWSLMNRVGTATWL